MTIQIHRTTVIKKTYSVWYLSQRQAWAKRPGFQNSVEFIENLRNLVDSVRSGFAIQTVFC
jgi:hypothetical protein